MDQRDVQFKAVRLTRKYAEKIDGVDLSRNQVGDLLDLSARDAHMLIAEGWAAPCEQGPCEQGRADGEAVATAGATHVSEPDSES